MTYLLIVFLVVLLVPLLAASWRVSLLGLAAQGFLLGWMALRGEHAPTLATGLVLLDAVVLRGILAPRLLHRALKASNAPRRNDVIAPNLFSWTLVATLVFASFRFAGAIERGNAASSLHIAVASSALLLGLFVLSSQNGTLSQIVGFLRLENAILLFELSIHHHFMLPVQAALLGIYLATVVLCARILREELSAPDNAATPPAEEPTL